MEVVNLRPTVSELRAMAMGATVRPHAGQPACVGACQLLANATGWAPGWYAAAVYDRPAPLAPGRPKRRWAQLVIAEGGDAGRAVSWFTAILAEWAEEHAERL
jgi:hypothetical protein